MWRRGGLGEYREAKREVGPEERVVIEKKIRSRIRNSYPLGHDKRERGWLGQDGYQTYA